MGFNRCKSFFKRNYIIWLLFCLFIGNNIREFFRISQQFFILFNWNLNVKSFAFAVGDVLNV